MNGCGMAINSFCLKHHLLQPIVTDHDNCEIECAVFIDQAAADSLPRNSLLGIKHSFRQVLCYVFESVDVAAVVRAELPRGKARLSTNDASVSRIDGILPNRTATDGPDPKPICTVREPSCSFSAFAIASLSETFASCESSNSLRSTASPLSLPTSAAPCAGADDSALPVAAAAGTRAAMKMNIAKRSFFIGRQGFVRRLPEQVNSSADASFPSHRLRGRSGLTVATLGRGWGADGIIVPRRLGSTMRLRLSVPCKWLQTHRSARACLELAERTRSC
jgi:hypothetical protein